MLARFVCPATRLAELPDVGRGVSVVLDGEFVGDPRVESVEVPPGAADGGSLTALASEVYVEVPLDDDLEARLAEIEQCGLRAKVRCGPAATPPVKLEWFLRECRVRGIAFKATAGLHHAMRTEREHGFLNLLAAAVFCDEDALREDDPEAFAVRADGFRWRGRAARTDELLHARRARLHSIGSCSFFEPVEELESLGILPL